MSNEVTRERLAEIKTEFQRLIEFHEASFREIDAKAKYWLTLSLPTFITLAGYLYKSGAQLELPLLVSGYALATILFIATFLLSYVLGSRRVESGILKPTSNEFSDVGYYLKTNETWCEYLDDQTAETLRAAGHNETQNNIKSRWLRLGEVSLLRGAPTAVCVGGGGAFAYTAASPSGLAAATPALAGAAAGIAIGGATAAVFVAISHFRTLSREKHKAA
ncbi:hypothetical protein B6V74_12875 [Thioclava sp. F42-5]|uniref:hypothetical protein n=1 Tax=Thioclava sp. F42-5 TaxID=1973005 RepID=UPI000B549133|nr:hypothetical protein [Thioclava sp. F42-5]OWY08713.1 hypothetical protein B6V74_12875 [Thioclava sp. F42-5]